ncbi:hypothetical protein [Oceanihabitans sediminis]|uniref:hypothetical protein n=1 Tax=Oceanihabitans sediminis TaxID=1812012 RepID=UPI003A929536
MNQKVTKENLIQNAKAELYSATLQAYRKYTDTVIKLAPSMSDDFHRFDQEMKTAKARLSQNLGAANKSAKGIIIQHYAEQLSETNDPNLSARVADDIFKITVGRSMAKNYWNGLFKREPNDISPYFKKGSEYKKSILESPVVLALKAHMGEFEDVLTEWRDTRENPFQQELDDVLIKYNRTQN